MTEKGIPLKTLIIFIVIILSFFIGCKPSDKILPGNVEKGEKGIDLSVTDSPALVVFYIGNCYWLNNNTWELLKIGQVLTENDVIKTDVDSYLEIQIGNKALLYIEENTEIALESLLYELDKKEMKIYLKKGSVFSSLKKLLLNESFELETPNVILSIRGTEFLVKESDEETFIAVEEGSVILLPPGLYEHMDDSPGKEYLSIFNQVKSSLIKEAPVLGKEKEIIITRETSLRMKEKVNAVLSLIKNKEQGESNITEEKIMNQVNLVSESLQQLEKGITDWTDDSKEEIKMKRHDVMINLTEDSSGKIIDIQKIDLTIVEIETDSDDALVYMNNDLIGKKRIGALYNAGEEFTFLVKCSGYEDTEFNLKTEAATHYSYNVRLLKEEISHPDDPLFEEKSENQEKEIIEPVTKDSQEQTVVIINTTPGDAAIYINEEYTAKGTYTGYFNKGDKFLILCKRKGYFDASLNAKIEEWGVKKIYTINLISKSDRERRFAVSNAQIIGQIEYRNNTLYIADKYGSLFAMDTSGKKKWTLSTDNNPNEHSYPVVIDAKVYFSGSDELVILDADSGNPLARKSLIAEDAHYFGRRLIPYKDKGIYPANNSLKIMNRQTGEFEKELPCPGGSRMTPILYKNRILIINQQGILLKINPESGIIEKEIPTHAGKSIALPVTIKNNFIYFADSSGHLVCIDMEVEQVLWEKEISGEKTTVYHRLEYGEKSINVFARGILYSMALETGVEHFPPIENVSCPPLYKDGMLIFGTTDGFLMFINEEDGKEIAKINVEQKITTRPVLADNDLLIGTETGNVFVITSY